MRIRPMRLASSESDPAFSRLAETSGLAVSEARRLAARLPPHQAGRLAGLTGYEPTLARIALEVAGVVMVGLAALFAAAGSYGVVLSLLTVFLGLWAVDRYLVRVNVRRMLGS